MSADTEANRRSNAMGIVTSRLGNPEHRAVGLLALRDVAEAYGGLATVAQEAGVTREALYRALSPSGNPTLKTLLAVLHAVGMRLSVVPAEPTPVHG